MGSWEDFLISSRLEPHLLDELRQELGDRFNDDSLSILSRQVKTKQDVKEVRTALTLLKSEISSDLFRALKEALQDIASDIDYMQTDLGKTVLAINRWLEPWYKSEIRSGGAFEDIMIGGRADQLFTVHVMGKVGSDADLERLRDLIASHAPPFKVVYSVDLEHRP